MTTGSSGALGNAPNEQSTMQQMSDQTREKAQELAGQAQAQAQEVAGQARNRLREQLDERSSQAAEQITTQASDLRSVSDTLREQGKQGPANAAGKLGKHLPGVAGRFGQIAAAPLVLAPATPKMRETLLTRPSLTPNTAARALPPWMSR